MVEEPIYKHCMYCNIVWHEKAKYSIDKDVLVEMFPDVLLTTGVCYSDICQMTLAAETEKSDDCIDSVMEEEYALCPELKTRLDAWVQGINLVSNKWKERE